MKSKRILVPLDGTPRAERALPTAMELLSDRPGATLVLLRAVDVRATPHLDPIDAQVVVARDAEAYLARVAERLSAQGLQRIVRSIWYTEPAKAIVEAARVRGVDVIVMTRQEPGRVGVSGGSIAESVLRGTTKPVVFVAANGAGELRTGAGLSAPAVAGVTIAAPPSNATALSSPERWRPNVPWPVPGARST